MFFDKKDTKKNGKEFKPHTCSDCGKTFLLMGDPVPGMPVFCRECYEKRMKSKR